MSYEKFVYKVDTYVLAAFNPRYKKSVEDFKYCRNYLDESDFFEESYNKKLLFNNST